MSFPQPTVLTPSPTQIGAASQSTVGDLVFETIERNDGNIDGVEQYEGNWSTAVPVTHLGEVDNLGKFVTPLAKSFLRKLDYTKHFAIAVFHGRRTDRKGVTLIDRVARNEDQITTTMRTYALESPAATLRASSPYELIVVEKNAKWPSKTTFTFEEKESHIASNLSGMPLPIQINPSLLEGERTAHRAGIALGFDIIEQREFPLMGQKMPESLRPSLYVIGKKDDLSSVAELVTPQAKSLLDAVDYRTHFSLILLQGQKFSTGYGITINEILQDDKCVNVLADFAAPKLGLASSPAWTYPYVVAVVKKQVSNPTPDRFNLIVDDVAIVQVKHETQ